MLTTHMCIMQVDTNQVIETTYLIDQLELKFAIDVCMISYFEYNDPNYKRFHTDLLLVLQTVSTV